MKDDEFYIREEKEKFDKKPTDKRITIIALCVALFVGDIVIMSVSTIIFSFTTFARTSQKVMSGSAQVNSSDIIPYALIIGGSISLIYSIVMIIMILVKVIKYSKEGSR